MGIIMGKTRRNFREFEAHLQGLMEPDLGEIMLHKFCDLRSEREKKNRDSLRKWRVITRLMAALQWHYRIFVRRSIADRKNIFLDFEF